MWRQTLPCTEIRRTLQPMATICSCNNTTAASTHTSTLSSPASSTCGTNCHQTRWGLLRSLNSRTDLPPPRCIKSYYGPCFISTSPCTVFTSFTNVLMFTWILSLHTFSAYFTHGPNTSASAQYDNTRGAWLTQEGCTVTERKEGRKKYKAVLLEAYFPLILRVKAACFHLTIKVLLHARVLTLICACPIFKANCSH